MAGMVYNNISSPQIVCVICYSSTDNLHFQTFKEELNSKLSLRLQYL